MFCAVKSKLLVWKELKRFSTFKKITVEYSDLIYANYYNILEKLHYYYAFQSYTNFLHDGFCKIMYVENYVESVEIRSVIFILQ